MITKRESRSIIRKALKRVPEGEEIRHLNIMPMMDIMTILLVAFIFSMNADSALDLGTTELPGSRSYDEKAENATALLITKTGILVDGSPVVDVTNGAIDASEKQGGALNRNIPRLSRLLGAHRRANAAQLQSEGKSVPETPELFILADKLTPYKLLYDVIATSRSEEAGFRRFRLLVLQGEKAQ